MNRTLIKYCRNLSGLSQKELAEKLGVHHSLISKIESGTTPATKETEVKLIQVFSDAGIDTQIIYTINTLIENHRKERKV